MEQLHLELLKQLDEKTEAKKIIGQQFITETNILKTDFDRLGMSKAWDDIDNDPIWRTMVCKIPNQHERQDDQRDVFAEKYAKHASSAISCLAEMCLQWYTLSCEIDDLLMQKTRVEREMQANKTVSIGQLYLRIESLSEENRLLREAYQSDMEKMRADISEYILKMHYALTEQERHRDEIDLRTKQVENDIIFVRSHADEIEESMLRYVWDKDVHVAFESVAKEGGLIHWLGTQGLRYNYESPLSNGTIGMNVYNQQGETKMYKSENPMNHFLSSTGYDFSTTSEHWHPYITVDIGKHRKMNVTHYTLKNIVPTPIANRDLFLQNWIFEATNDLGSAKWITLRRHVGDPTFSACLENSICSFEITNDFPELCDTFNEQTGYFRYFRVRHTDRFMRGNDQTPKNHFYVGGFNLFGDLRIVDCM